MTGAKDLPPSKDLDGAGPLSGDENERSLEFVMDSGRAHFLTKAQRRVIRLLTGLALFLCFLGGSYLKYGAAPFWDRAAVFAAAVLIGLGLPWLYLKLAAVPSVSVPVPPLRERFDPEYLVWSLCFMIPGVFALGVAIWLFAIMLALTRGTFEPGLLMPVWFFLAPLIGSILLGRFLRRKFPKQTQS